MNDKVLTIKNCVITNSKKKTNNKIVSIDNLEVTRGDSIFILGNNGSGKSTLIKALFSIKQKDDYYEVNKGAVVKIKSYNFNHDLLLNDSESVDICDVILGFTYIEQEEVFRKSDSVIKCLEIVSEVALKHVKHLLSNDDYVKKLNTLNEMVSDYALEYFEDLYKYNDRYLNCDSNAEKKDIAIRILKKKNANDCSGGQKKLVSILAGLIKAQILETDIIAMDEPFNHLDHKNKVKIRNLITDIKNNRKNTRKPVTLFIVSHCLIFDFINDDDCQQYIIKNTCTEKLPNDKKIFHSCLNSNLC